MAKSMLKLIQERAEALQHVDVPPPLCPRCSPTEMDGQLAIGDRDWLLQALERAKRHAASALKRLEEL
jgi:hypothetical protein